MLNITICKTFLAALERTVHKKCGKLGGKCEKPLINQSLHFERLVDKNAIHDKV